MIRLNVGCGPNVFPEWTNIDREDQSSFIDHMAMAPSTDGWPAWQAKLAMDLRSGKRCEFTQWDLRRGFPDVGTGTVNSIYLGQMIEHLNFVQEVHPFLSECFRMLKSGGCVRITTPNLQTLVEAYVEGRLDQFEDDQPGFFKGAAPSDQLAFLMYGASGPQNTWDHYEGHMHLFTPYSLARVLKLVGFEQIRTEVANVSHHPAMTGFNDLGMSYGFAMEAVKP